MGRGLRSWCERQRVGKRCCIHLEPESIRMMDVLYIVLTGSLFALTWGLVRLCERV
jgi:hypothetical protein